MKNDSSEEDPILETYQDYAGDSHFRKVIPKIAGLAALYFANGIFGFSSVLAIVYLYLGFKVGRKAGYNLKHVSLYVSLVLWLPLVFYGLIVPDKWRLEK